MYICIYVYIYMYKYVYICVCLSVCACVNDDDDDVYPRETPPHIRAARASPQWHTAAGTAAPTTADTGNTVPQRANLTQTAYAHQGIQAVHRVVGQVGALLQVQAFGVAIKGVYRYTNVHGLKRYTDRYV